MCVTGFLIFFVDGVLLQVIKYLVFKVCFLLLIIILALRCFFILYYPILYSPNSFILFESYFSHAIPNLRTLFKLVYFVSTTFYNGNF